MAALTSSDYGKLRRRAYSSAGCKAELKALPNLPAEPKLLAIFQAAEDRTVTAFTLFKADVELHLGQTITLAFARKLFAGFLAWRMEQ